MTTVNTPSLSQAVIGGMLLHPDCRLREANERSRAFYAGNLTALLAALERHFPPPTGTRSAWAGTPPTAASSPS